MTIEKLDEFGPVKTRISATRLDRAAKKIMLRWLCMMIDGECALGNMTVRQWMLAASKDSQVMHDNCDANMIFLEVLREEKLAPKRGTPNNKRDEDIWNAVTASDMYRLECCARAISDLLK